VAVLAAKSTIAKALRVSRNTVSAIAEQEWLKVEKRKARIAAQAELAATKAFDRINQKLDAKDDIPLNLFVPVAGVSVDKLLALRGDSQMTIQLQLHHSRPNELFERFQQFHERIKTEADQSRNQFALPNGRQFRIPEAETGQEARNKRLKTAKISRSFSTV
jgi:hypothetical protein